MAQRTGYNRHNGPAYRCAIRPGWAGGPGTAPEAVALSSWPIGASSR